MSDSVISPVRTGVFNQEQEHDMTSEQLHLLVGDVVNTPVPVHDEAKDTIVEYLQYSGVRSQEDLSLLGESDLPRSMHAEDADKSTPYDFMSGESRRIGAFRSIMFRKRFLQIIRYVREGSRLRIGCTMRDIDITLRAIAPSPIPMRVGTPLINSPFLSPGLNTTGGSSSVNYAPHKVKLSLKEFSGKDEDFLSFKKMIRARLGAQGLLSYIDDVGSFHANRPVSETVYYKLADALNAGVASFLVNEHQPDKNAYKLWSDVLSHYKHMDSGDNQILLSLRDMLTLKLTADVDAQQFYNDFKVIINRLTELNSSLVREKPFIRAILLNAIQDESYDMVRNYITKNPSHGASEILEEIRQRRITLSTFEVGQASQVARRSKVTFDREKSRRPEGTTASSQTGWRIPFIPMTEIGIVDDHTRSNIAKWRQIVNANPAATLDELDELVVNKMRPAPTYRPDDDFNTGRNKQNRNSYYADDVDRPAKRSKRAQSGAGRRDVPQPRRQRQSSKYDRYARNSQLARRTELAMRMILGEDSSTDASDEDAGCVDESTGPKVTRRATTLKADPTHTEDAGNDRNETDSTTEVRKYGRRAAGRG